MVDGRVLLLFLSKANEKHLKYPIDNAIDSEIIAQKIPINDKKFIKEYWEVVKLNTIPILVKTLYLKTCEARQKMIDNPNLNKEEAKKMTNLILPFSDKTITVLEKKKATVPQK